MNVNKKGKALRILIGITGASGSIYAQRLLDNIDSVENEVHIVLSKYAQSVIEYELEGGLRFKPEVMLHPEDDMNVPYVSGSNPFDVMVVVPCSMGTLARVAQGLSNNALTRAADVMLKERRKLILVPRETPLNLVHIKNMELLTLAGAIIIPANPSFYSRPSTVEQVVDTVVARILDHIGLKHNLVKRWKDPED